MGANLIDRLPDP